MKRSLLITSCFALLILLSYSFTSDEPRYKNLKVLPRNTTKQQMDSVMRHFTQALGVKCNFCHQFNQEQKAMDFASDALENKGVARSMMKMTQKLNKKYFKIKDTDELTTKLEVTCYTCHNGREHPARFATANNMPPAPMNQRMPSDSTRRQ